MNALLAWGAIALAMVVIGAEVAARIMGWHRPLLYERTDYGYRVKPGQSVRLLGNVVSYNEHGLRSGPMAASPAPGVTRILCIGDSITNGGTRVDQSGTYPGLLERMLGEAGHRVEVFNASAGGWALENEAGWVARHGIFDALIVVLQVATHDLFQRMAGSHLVDLNPSFPSAPPALALVGVWRRVVMPRLGLGVDTRDPGFETGVYSSEDVRRGIAAIERVREFVDAKGARLVLVHVEQPDGLEPLDELTNIGKAMLSDWAARTGTTLVRTSDAIRAAGGRTLFVDAVHPNEQGNRVIAGQVSAAVVPLLAGRMAEPGAKESAP